MRVGRVERVLRIERVRWVERVRDSGRKVVLIVLVFLVGRGWRSREWPDEWLIRVVLIRIVLILVVLILVLIVRILVLIVLIVLILVGDGGLEELSAVGERFLVVHKEIHECFYQTDLQKSMEIMALEPSLEPWVDSQNLVIGKIALYRDSEI